MPKKQKKRDTYKYHYIHKGKVDHRGVTDDLSRREEEHQRKWPGGWIKQIGRITNREAALKWELKGGKRLKK